MYFSSEVLPEMETFLDEIAINMENMEPDEVVPDSISYSTGYYKGAKESICHFMKLLGWEVEINTDDNGNHTIELID